MLKSFQFNLSTVKLNSTVLFKILMKLVTLIKEKIDKTRLKKFFYFILSYINKLKRVFILLNEYEILLFMQWSFALKMFNIIYAFRQWIRNIHNINGSLFYYSMQDSKIKFHFITLFMYVFMQLNGYASMYAWNKLVFANVFLENELFTYLLWN